MTLPPRNFAKRGRDGRLRSPQHLAFVRSHLCVAWEAAYRAGHSSCYGKVEAAHLRDLAPLGHGGPKPADLFTIALCARYHRESEKREQAWQAERRLDLMALALEFAAKSPDPRVREAAKEYRESLLQR